MKKEIEFLLNGRNKAIINFALYKLQNLVNKRPRIMLNPQPTSLQIEINTSCNVNCDVCLINQIKPSLKNKYMSIKTFNKIIPIFPYIYELIIIGYGEPFLHPKFLKMLCIAKKYNLIVTFNTNTILLNKDMLDSFYLIGTKLKIGISFLGKDYVFKKVKKLLPYKPKNVTFTVNYVLSKNTIEKAYNHLDLINELGIKYIHYTGLIAYYKKYEGKTLYRMDDDIVETYLNRIRNKARKLGIKIRLPSVKPKINSCKEPFQCMFVNFEGNVSVCSCHYYSPEEYYYVDNGSSIFDEYIYIINEKNKLTSDYIGNVHKENILDLWNNEKYKSLRSLLKNHIHPVCNRCLMEYNLH